VEAVSGLEPIETLVAGSMFGLWGRPQRSIAEIATDLGTTATKV
jgi:hypothetical protein